MGIPAGEAKETVHVSASEDFCLRCIVHKSDLLFLEKGRH